MSASRGHRPQFSRSGCCSGAEASEAPQNHTTLLGDEHLSGATARLSIILGQKKRKSSLSEPCLQFLVE